MINDNSAPSNNIQNLENKISRYFTPQNAKDIKPHHIAKALYFDVKNTLGDKQKKNLLENIHKAYDAYFYNRNSEYNQAIKEVFNTLGLSSHIEKAEKQQNIWSKLKKSFRKLIGNEAKLETKDLIAEKITNLNTKTAAASVMNDIVENSPKLFPMEYKGAKVLPLLLTPPDLSNQQKTSHSTNFTLPTSKDNSPPEVQTPMQNTQRPINAKPPLPPPRPPTSKAVSGPTDGASLSSGQAAKPTSTAQALKAPPMLSGQSLPGSTMTHTLRATPPPVPLPPKADDIRQLFQFQNNQCSTRSYTPGGNSSQKSIQGRGVFNP
jgi:uncharacterized protein (DUF2267 family)